MGADVRTDAVKAPPKVSVVIPCFNLGRYLDETVDSVLKQTMCDFEIIIVNPGSTDGQTNALLADYRRPKTTIIRTGPKTAGGARNTGISVSRAAYIICLDADDLLEPECLEKTSRILDASPEVGLVTFWYKMFGDRCGEVTPKSASLVDFLIENCACTASLFRREAWEKAGGYDEELPGYEDWDFWISILENGYSARIIEEFLFRYRERSGGKHRRSDSAEFRDGIMRRIMERHAASFRAHAMEVIAGKDRMMGEYRRYWEHAVAEGERRAGDIQHRLNLVSDELSEIKSSRPWRLACAICETRHSLQGLALLPFRLVDILCPKHLKRIAKRAFLVAPDELWRKNFFKMPYRLAARLAPEQLKRRLPIPLVNAARRMFFTGLPRLFRQERWPGPIVTVVIPCHNYGQYLDESLGSALGQTLRNIEVIIIDDGSDDAATMEKLAEIKRRGIPNLRIMRQENQGVSRARNNAIAKAGGKYICCLDADDLIMPTYLEKCAAAMEAERLDICYSWVRLFGDEDGVRVTEPIDPKLLLVRNCVPTCAVFSKRIWERVGGFSPEVEIGAEDRSIGRRAGGLAGRGYEDWDLWLSIAEAGGRGKVIPEPLFLYRRHGGGRGIGDVPEIHERLFRKIQRKHGDARRLSAGKRRKVRWQAVNPELNLRVRA